MLVSVLVVLLMTASALGGGLLIQRLVRPSEAICPLVRLTSALVLGIGLLGWLGFFFALFGLLSPALLVVMLCIPLLGLFGGNERPFPAIGAPPRDGVIWILLAALLLVLSLNLLEGLAPPIDADSLAYHFDLPKMFLREGRLVFVPKAVEGAIPLLLHMTYMTALGIGGEKALTLWTMVTGWAAGALLFAVCRVYVGTRWALFVSLIFLTTPAVVYVAGSGQIEVRTAAFVLAASFWALHAAKNSSARAAILAGLATGFFVASKYTGLLFLAAVGLTLLIRGRKPGPVLAFGAAVLLAGSQWYLWNWWNTGDPLFPTLYGILPYHADIPWNATALTDLKTFFLQSEKPLPATVLWLFGYPFLATVAPLPAFESLRVGFGPYVLLLLPLALAAGWARRDVLRRSDMLFYGAICFIAYALWFFLGPSLRLRHLLPLYPLLMIAVSTAAVRGAGLWPKLRGPLGLAMGLTLIIQLGGQGLFSLKYAQRLVAGETRAEFLQRTIPGFGAVRWINRNLPPDAHLMTTIREITYLFDVPTFMAHLIYQKEVQAPRSDADIEQLWRQLRKKKLTDVLIVENSSFDGPMKALVRIGCAEMLKRFPVRSLESRTLPTLQSRASAWILYHLRPDRCTLPRPDRPAG